MPNHKALAEAFAALSPEEQIPFFIENILPLLIEGNHNKAGLVYLLGNTGAGKSALVNYLLGHRFKLDKFGVSLVGVVDEATCPYAQIGTDKATSCTLFPWTYSVPDNPYSYCDYPGFGETRDSQLTEMQQFSMALAHQMAKSVRATIIVISKSEIGSARGALSKALFKALQHLFSNGAKPTNLLFVLNNQGDVRFKQEYYLVAFQEAIQKLEVDYKELLQVKQNIEAAISNQAVNTTAWHTAVQFIKSRISSQIDESYPAFCLEMVTDALASLQATKALYALINTENSVVWDTHDNPACREAIFTKLSQLQPEAISKTAFHFEPSTAMQGVFRKQLLAWVSKKQTPLAQLLNEKRALVESFSKSSVMSIPTVLGHFQKFLSQLLVFSTEIAGLEQLRYFAAVELQEDENQGFLSVYSTASVKPYSFRYEDGAHVPFTQIYNYVEGQDAKQHGLPEMFKEKGLCLKKMSAQIEHRGDTITYGGEQFIYYTSLRAVYQAQNFGARIPSQKIAEYWGLTLDHPDTKTKLHKLVMNLHAFLTDLTQFMQNQRCGYLNSLSFFIKFAKYVDAISTQYINYLTNPHTIWEQRYAVLTKLAQEIVTLNTATQKAMQLLALEPQVGNTEKRVPETIQSEQERAYFQQIAEVTIKQNTALGCIKTKLAALQPQYDGLYETLSILQEMLVITTNTASSNNPVIDFFSAYNEAYSSQVSSLKFAIPPSKARFWKNQSDKVKLLVVGEAELGMAGGEASTVSA